MKKLGESLLKVCRKENPHDCLKIGIELVSNIEKIHKLGLLHCDLKVDNILIDKDSSTSIKKNPLHIIDFGMARPYLKADGSHVPNKRQTKIIGSY